MHEYQLIPDHKDMLLKLGICLHLLRSFTKTNLHWTDTMLIRCKSCSASKVLEKRVKLLEKRGGTSCE